MKISRETLEQFEIKYDITRLAQPEELLFLDIETTGFTARSSYLYLIGCAYYENGNWCTIQWLAENYEQELDVLNSLNSPQATDISSTLTEISSIFRISLRNASSMASNTALTMSRA